MAFLRCNLFEIEVRDGEIIGSAPDFVIETILKAFKGVPPYEKNPDNFAARNAAVLYGIEYTPGTSSERQVDLDALSPIGW